MTTGRVLRGLVWFSVCGVLLVSPIRSWARPSGTQPRPPSVQFQDHGTLLGRYGANEVCAVAIRATELRYHLPHGLLFAMGQVESGRPDPVEPRVEPWPWTVQAENRSLYFATKAEATSWVAQATARGLLSIDVGCLQVNLYYHPHAFATIEDAFDPMRNTDYAARFLRSLFSATGDWRLATGLYHSHTNDLAVPYQQRVERALKQALITWPTLAQPPSLATMLGDAWRHTYAASHPPATVSANNWDQLLQPRFTRLPRPPTFQAAHSRLIKTEHYSAADHNGIRY